MNHLLDTLSLIAWLMVILGAGILVAMFLMFVGIDLADWLTRKKIEAEALDRLTPEAVERIRATNGDKP